MSNKTRKIFHNIFSFFFTSEDEETLELVLSYCGDETITSDSTLLPVVMERHQKIFGTKMETLSADTGVVARVFDLSKIKDTEEYQVIRNAIYTGWYKELYVERRWLDDPLRMVIYIEFAVRERHIRKPMLLLHNDPLYNKKVGRYTALQ